MKIIITFLISVSIWPAYAKNCSMDTEPKGIYFLAENARDQDLRKIIDNGIDINTSSPNGSTLLHYAAYNGHASTVILLLNSGANIHVKNACGWTPMTATLSNSPGGIINISTIKTLVRNGANINDRSNTNVPVIHQAIFSLGQYFSHPIAQQTDIEIADKAIIKFIEWAINNGANVNATHSHNLTPLHWAVLLNHPDLVSLFLSKGANVNAKATNGNTPLKLALKKNYTKIASILKEHGGKL